MKKIISIVSVTLIGMSTFAQVNGVGINKENPEAALDIKAANTSDEILRFSTPPSSMSSDDNDFVFFVGDPVTDGGGSTVAYDLRSLTLPNFVSKMNNLFPSLNKITITNSSEQEITKNSPTNLTLDTELINTNETVFRYATNENAIEFNKSGYYEITSFVGFEQLRRFEGDILINVVIKKNGTNAYELYKSAIISRTRNKSNYDQGTGVGSSFSFVNKFEKGDRVKIQVNDTYRNRTGNNDSDDTKILPYGATISATRLSPLL